MVGLQHTLGDLGRAVRRLNQDIATLGTESRSDSLSESVYTLEELGTSFDTELEVLQRIDVSWRSRKRSFGSCGKGIVAPLLMQQ